MPLLLFGMVGSLCPNVFLIVTLHLQNYCLAVKPVEVEMGVNRQTMGKSTACSSLEAAFKGTKEMANFFWKKKRLCNNKVLPERTRLN
mgnify:CR=1 FL=1